MAKFFNSYNKIITAKLNSGDYILKYRYIYVRINDRYDITLYSSSTVIKDVDTLEVNIIRYSDITGYARKHNLYEACYFKYTIDDDEYGLYSLYYSKCLDIHSTLIMPEKTDMFSSMINDIRVEQIEDFLCDSIKIVKNVI